MADLFQCDLSVLGLSNTTTQYKKSFIEFFSIKILLRKQSIAAANLLLEKNVILKKIF